VGKSEHLHAVHASLPGAAVGELHRLCITAAGPHSLAGAGAA
jgi:hypothetical protein